MLVQSGRPVGVMQTHEWAPRVLIANSNLVGDWANWEEFRRLEALGLTMYGQMTAGSWIYIGTQGILQGTYETFAAVAAKRFGGTLAGTITLTAGLGGMGGAQPLAVTMNDGVAICVDCDPRAIDAPHRAPLPRREGRIPRPRPGAGRPPPATGASRCPSDCSATPPTCCRGLLAMGAPIDIVTDQTSAHDPLAYLPFGIDFDDMAAYARRQARRVHAGRPRVDGPARRGDGRLPGRGRRGLRLRQLHPRRGPTRRLRAGVRLPRLRARVHPAAVLRGQGPVPLGGAVRRPEGHRRHRPGDPGAVPGERVAGPLDQAGRRTGRTSRACPPASAGSATASATRRASGSTTWWPAAS